MGGAVGGMVKSVGQVVGLNKENPAGRAVQAAIDSAATKTESTKATRSEEEAGARMRGARRRGRSLLSDARLMGEAGIETLGGGQNL